MKRTLKGMTAFMLTAGALSGALVAASPAGAAVVPAGPPNDTVVVEKDIAEWACLSKMKSYNTFQKRYKYFCVTSNPPKMNLMRVSRA
ncbi:hypothetical protein [Nocardiopsis potens]|uniref:hypothetical protein n=1 Tax=Nocardiopsis potens TaxID=1246458 RepID=UPI00034D4771|nr:hypothetical protein [Nocardiopsis potens]